MRNSSDQETLAFLVKHANKLDPKIKAAIEANDVKIIECNHFLKVDLTDNKNILLELSSAALRGVNTFDKGKTPSLENIVLKGLRLSHAKVVTADIPLGAAKFSSVVDAAIDPAWLNGTLIFKQDNKEILRMPVSRFYHAAATDRAQEYEGLNFENFRLIKADTSLDITFEYPQGVSITPGAGNSFYAQIEFKGGQTTAK
ncbi:hypothetical protein [Roseivirga seohaensis]|uniref:hypothetical protein n=1 Tax=Roseivirga seohaensis TaxID=1914963 RepID=UPI003BACC5D9